MHALGPFLTAAAESLASELPRAGSPKSLLTILTGRGARAGTATGTATAAAPEHRALPLAPSVLRTLRAETAGWVVPFRDSALGPLSPDAALLAGWYDQTLCAWLPAVVCPETIPTHILCALRVFASRLCVLACLLCSEKKDHVLRRVLRKAGKREQGWRQGWRQRKERVSAAPPPRVPGTRAGHLCVLSPDHPRQRRRL